MSKTKNLIALFIIAFIPFGIMLWYRVHQPTGFATQELIIYPLLFGGISIVLIWLAKKYFLKEPVAAFNSGKGYFFKDWFLAIILTIIYFILFYSERATLRHVLQLRPNTELLNLMLDMREKPLLIALWFGPVLWIGIALYEELLRVFMLTSLWKFSDNKLWSIIVIAIISIIIGLSHWSQGSYGIVTIALKSLVACFFFYKHRRLLPLIIAHALYDGIQVALLLLTYPS